MKKPKNEPQLSDYFTGCLYFTAGRLYREIERMAFDAFRPLDLAPSHAFLIMALHEAGAKGSTPSDLAKTMSLDRSTVTRLLGFLIQRQLVKLEKDGKFKTVRPTAKGSNLMPEIRKAWTQLYDQYCEEWGEQRANTINSCINKNLILKG